MELIVVGAGVVGLSFSAFLLSLLPSAQITLVDANSNRDRRVSAVTTEHIIKYKALGLLPAIMASAPGIFNGMRLWNGCDYHKNMSLLGSKLGWSELGYIIENAKLQEILNAHLQGRLKFVQGVASDLEVNEREVILKVNEQNYAAQLLIGADGGNSWVRNSVAIATETCDYGQSALCMTLATQLKHQNLAYQSFNDLQTIALLPLTSQNQVALIWSAARAKIEEVLQLSTSDILSSLDTELGQVLGAMTAVSHPASFKLISRNAKQYVRPRVALIGDSAHVIHPLAGQGMNLGLADAYALAKLLAEAKPNQDIGAYSMLRKYERRRRTANSAMHSFVDLVARKSSLLGLINWSWLDNFGLMQDFMLRYASGVSNG